MRYQPSATGPQYQQEFNNELARQLKTVRQAQPNHIPVFSMKYKNACKYLIQDLQEPLALFPKKFKLHSVYDIIEKQSLQFSQDKLRHDSKVKNQGPNFKLPQFYLHTISMIKPDEEKGKSESKLQRKSGRPIGFFVKLDLEMTFEEAFQNYGRQNVLTIVYTDATEVNHQSNQVARVQKWLTRIIIFILILVLIPFLMKSETQNFDSSINLDMKGKSHQQNSDTSTGKMDTEDSPDSQNSLEIDIVDSEPLSFEKERTFDYDEESI